MANRQLIGPPTPDPFFFIGGRTPNVFSLDDNAREEREVNAGQARGGNGAEAWSWCSITAARRINQYHLNCLW